MISLYNDGQTIFTPLDKKNYWDLLISHITCVEYFLTFHKQFNMWS